MFVCVATSLFMYKRAKECMKSTAVVLGDTVGSQNDEGEKGVSAVAKKMDY